MSTDSDSGSTTSTSSPGMTASENAVEFINNAVLNPTATSMANTSKPMVDQAAGMMIQDARAFLQSNEQIMTAAMAKAAAMMLVPATSAEGATAMAALTAALTTLAAFSATVGTTAAGIITDFDT